jgi:hypothetical protein
MPTSKVKLKTNVPLTGFARQAYYNKGKLWPDPEQNNEMKQLPDSINLKGSWDGSSDESLYLPVALAGQMLDMGLIRQEQAAGKDGEPRYTVLQTQKKVRVIKVELDGNKKKTYISWADVPPPENNQQAAPPAAASKPQQPAAAAAPARAATADNRKPGPTDEQQLERVRKTHRKALNTIGETQANAWRGAKYQIDLLLAEWSIERTQIPTHVYLDLIARFGASSGIEAFKQNLIVEHKPKKDPSPAPGVKPAAQAMPLKQISDDTTTLQPVAPQPEPLTEREELDEFPNFPDMPGEDDDLPF